jgi:DNA polymerase III epsilon subunit-like protein
VIEKVPVTLDDFMKRDSIAVVDIETTGFSHQEDCIIEIGVCELDLASGEYSELFNQLIQENHISVRHRNAWIFKNSDLKYEDILEARHLKDYTKELQRIFNKYPATAFNKRFDFDFLKDRGFIIKELPCPMIAATDILKLPPRMPGTLYKWPSVEETWKFLFPNRGYIEKHRSYDDSVHEALIIFELYKGNNWQPIIETKI